jgi:MFS transporter, DHA2 family, multidrug resistance protein
MAGGRYGLARRYPHSARRLNCDVALPYMQRSFGVGVERISWVVTSYLAAVSVMIPMSGWLAVRIGRRRYRRISVVTFVPASALCAVSLEASERFVVFRVMQGLAGAAMMPHSQAIMLETLVEEHPLAMTTFGIGLIATPKKLRPIPRAPRSVGEEKSLESSFIG